MLKAGNFTGDKENDAAEIKFVIIKINYFKIRKHPKLRMLFLFLITEFQKTSDSQGFHKKLNLTGD